MPITGYTTDSSEEMSHRWRHCADSSSSFDHLCLTFEKYCFFDLFFDFGLRYCNMILRSILISFIYFLVSYMLFFILQNIRENHLQSMNKYFLKNDMISKEQFGFRAEHSTSHVIADVNKLKISRDKKNLTA